MTDEQRLKAQERAIIEIAVFLEHVAPMGFVGSADRRITRSIAETQANSGISPEEKRNTLEMLAEVRRLITAKP